jgi:hypothetical protein
MTRSTSIFSVTVLLVTAIASAQAPQASPPPCAGDEYRQFDFWLGAWQVADRDGNALGTNKIEPILGGCALRESWVGASGSVGHSFNIFDRQSGRWHQTWVDNSGLLLQIEGGLDTSGAMVLTGTGKSSDGRAQQHRITWTPLPDGRVRQHWELSTDEGAWSDAFVGFYARQPDLGEPEGGA